MKFSKLVVMALLAAGVTFVFTGCGDKKEEAAESKKTEKSEKSEKKSGAKAAADKIIKKEAKEDGISNAKFVKEVKVSKNYIVVCYNAKSEKKGKIKLGAHVVKKGGKWKAVDFEDNWEPKSKYEDSEDEDSEDSEDEE
ncbi:MAG: hypothetical protein E7040_10775 [Lentisphaerae bacterium]|nr:hypothetical protein [Lentisphaerota bacterium]